MKLRFIILVLLSLNFCTPKQTNKTIEKENLENQNNVMENYNLKFDSLANIKISNLILESSKIHALQSTGKNYKYKFSDTQDLRSEFSTDDIFLPFYLELMDENSLFKILETLTEAKWRSVISYLKEFSVPNLKDKRRLMKLISQNTKERFKLETESLIFATQFYKEKDILREHIKSIMKTDNEKFLHGEGGKFVLLDKLAYRYAYENVDKYSIELLELLVDRHHNHNYTYRSGYFHPTPLHYFLYFEPKSCENTLSYIYNNSKGQIKKETSNYLTTQKERCIVSEDKFFEVDKIITSAKKVGLMDFNLKDSDKLFLTNEKESYGGSIPKLKIVEYSTIGIPFSEINESLNPAVEITIKIYKKYLEDYIDELSIIENKEKKYLIIKDKSKEPWAFDITDVKYVSLPDNKLTDIFNYFLSKQKTKSRLVALGDRGTECIIVAEPNKVKTFANENEIEILNGEL